MDAWTLDMSDDERAIITGVRPGHGHEPLGDGMRSVEVVPADQLRGAVEAERERNVALVRALAANGWDPSVEAALREAARQITDGGGR